MGKTHYPMRSRGREVIHIPVDIEGAGASDPTKLYGPGVTATRTGTGVYKFVFNDVYAQLINVKWGLRATTPSDLAGFTVVSGDLDTSDNSVSVSVYDAAGTPAVHDLVAGEKLGLTFELLNTTIVES